MAHFVNKKSDFRKTSASKNKLYEPSVAMIVDDEIISDNAGATDKPENTELSNLNKESNVPLKKLLTLCGYSDISETKSLGEKNLEPSEPMEEDEADLPETSSLYKDTREHDTSKFLRSDSRVSEDDDDEDEEGYDYDPDSDEWRKVNKTIMVGSDYQATVPEGLSHYGDSLPYENEDKLLWDPDHLDIDVIEDFLRKAAALAQPAIPLGVQVRDDEQALYLSQQCGHNVEEALRRIRITVVPNSEANASVWSEEECRNFESGVRCFGKNFRLIQQHKVRTRTVGELVQFYYLWKKTERHDMFANKNRLEKKKYTLHPGLTDFMDRFLEDQDDRDRSSSPSVQISTTDSKRPSISSMNPKPPP